MIDSTIQLGDWVQAVRDIYDVLPDSDGNRIRQAGRGSIGHVIERRLGYLPTIFWESTGAVSDCEPGHEFKRLGGADTGRFPHMKAG